MKIEQEGVDESVVTLDSYNSDLNLVIDATKYSAHPLTKEGFSFMWAGARATHGAAKGKFCFEVKVLEHLSVPHLPKDEPSPHVVRVGVSVESSTLQLGEDPLSYGYGGSGKVSTNCQFKDFGDKFAADDCILCAVNFESDQVQVGYAKNGKFLGWAFKINKSELQGNALFPHILTKNCSFEVNFGQKQQPYFDLPEPVKDYTFIGCLPVDLRIAGARAPKERQDCEMIMMCGLPGAGKSVWAAEYSAKNPDKKYNILGTNNIIDKMKVMGLPRKRNYSGRWDVLIQMATKCINKMFEIGSKLRRNYILDQTNVFPTAQKRKMRNFEGFKRIAVVVVPNDEEYRRRCDKQEREEGKEIPDKVVSEMKFNFKLPEVGEVFDKLIFTELQQDEAEKLLKQYNEEGKAAMGPSKKVFRPNDSEGNKGLDTERNNLNPAPHGGFDANRGHRGFDKSRGYGGSDGGRGRGGFRGGRGGFDSGRGSFDGGRGGFGGGRGGFNGGRGGFRGGFDRGRGGFDRGRGGFDRGRGGFDRGRGGFDRGRGGFEGGRGRFEGGRGGFGDSRGGFDTFDSGRGAFNGSRGTFNSARGAFDGGRGAFDGGRGGFDGGRGSFDGGRGSFDGSRGGYNGDRGGFERGRGGARGGRGGHDGGRFNSGRGGFGQGRGNFGGRGSFDSSRGQGNNRDGFPRKRGYDEMSGNESSNFNNNSPGNFDRGGLDTYSSFGSKDYNAKNSQGRHFTDNRKDSNAQELTNMRSNTGLDSGNVGYRGNNFATNTSSGFGSQSSYSNVNYGNTSNTYDSQYSSYGDYNDKSQKSQTGFKSASDNYLSRDTSRSYTMSSGGAFKKEPSQNSGSSSSNTDKATRVRSSGRTGTRWSAETPATPAVTTTDTSYSSYVASVKSEAIVPTTGGTQYDTYSNYTQSNTLQGFPAATTYGYQSPAMTTPMTASQWPVAQISSLPTINPSGPTAGQSQWSQYYQTQSNQYFSQYYMQPTAGTAPAYGTTPSYGTK